MANPGAGWRKALTVLHVVGSVGLLGSAAVALLLALVGATSTDHQLVLSSYRLINLQVHVLGLPLLLLGAVTGVVLSLITRWGLVRHKWVLLKEAQLVLVLLTGGFVLRPWIAALTTDAGHGALRAGLGADRWLLVGGEAFQIASLCLATLLSVYKPSTPAQKRRAADAAAAARRSATSAAAAAPVPERTGTATVTVGAASTKGGPR